MENRTDYKLGGQVKAMKWNIREKYEAKGTFVRNWTFRGNKHSDNWLLTLKRVAVTSIYHYSNKYNLNYKEIIVFLP